MKYGYARCSLAEEKGQDLNRQTRELKAAGAEEIIMEREHGDAKVKQNLDRVNPIFCVNYNKAVQKAKQLRERAAESSDVRLIAS